MRWTIYASGPGTRRGQMPELGRTWRHRWLPASRMRAALCGEASPRHDGAEPVPYPCNRGGAEVRERIPSLPAFQENGRFIGDQRYRALLKMQTPPMRPDEFEDQVRRSIVNEKLQAALTGWITVADPDVEKEFKRRNERVK